MFGARWLFAFNAVKALQLFVLVLGPETQRVNSGLVFWVTQSWEYWHCILQPWWSVLKPFLGSSSRPLSLPNGNDMRDDTYQTHLEIAARRQHHGIHSEIQRHLRLLHLLAPLLAVLSGILHAYGMALRKRHGNDASNARYWMQPGWWIGLLMDALGGGNGCIECPTHSWSCEFMWIFSWGAANERQLKNAIICITSREFKDLEYQANHSPSGLAFTLAAPLMAVELLVPLTAVSQLAAAFLCGCCIFQERSTVMQQVGFVTWPKMEKKHGDLSLWEKFREF